MPPQKRPHPRSPLAIAGADPEDEKEVKLLVKEEQSTDKGFEGEDGGEEEVDESDGKASSSGSEWEEEEMDDNDPYITVRLSDIRKEVQCPICLGIIRKTRTVMECLHRFCRECIDKSMRLGNNECPACRTHCASRRSLRDDSNYDALIATLYPDIDKYEEEELALLEEEKSHNKKIQDYIAETFRRQSEALGRRKPTAKATAAVFARRSRGNFRNHVQNRNLCGRGESVGRDVAVAPSDDDGEEEANGNDGCKDSSSAGEPSPDQRQKRCRRGVAPQSSPARAAGNSDVACGDNDDLVDINKENSIGTSPLRPGNREMLAWGKNGTRSQTRHGNASGLNGRTLKGGRTAKLVEYLHTSNVDDNELDVQLTLVPLDKKSTQHLEQQYICCRPTLSIRHLCEFIARQISLQPEEIQLYARKNQGLKILEGQESLAAIYPSFTKGRQGLELIYHLKGRARPDA